eukprot:COSAG06_NODE_5567_length_3397_cov_3.112492_5_plen_247_part_01
MAKLANRGETWRGRLQEDNGASPAQGSVTRPLRGTALTAAPRPQGRQKRPENRAEHDHHARCLRKRRGMQELSKRVLHCAASSGAAAPSAGAAAGAAAAVPVAASSAAFFAAFSLWGKAWSCDDLLLPVVRAAASKSLHRQSRSAGICPKELPLLLEHIVSNQSVLIRLVGGTVALNKLKPRHLRVVQHQRGSFLPAHIICRVLSSAYQSLLLRLLLRRLLLRRLLLRRLLRRLLLRRLLLLRLLLL